MTDQPIVGEAVTIVTEDYRECSALVVAVHGVGYDHEDWGYVGPAINVVFVTADPQKHDPHGMQLERYSSLSHFNIVRSMPKPGRYWRKP